MAEAATAATTRKTTTRKPAARKTAATKKTVRKTTAKRTTVRKVAPAKPNFKLDNLSDTAREVAYVQLGICGTVYDELNARVSKARKDAPKRWNSLVKRGEQVQRDLEKAQGELQRDLKKRVNKLEAKADIEGRVEQVRDTVNKFVKRVRKAA